MNSSLIGLHGNLGSFHDWDFLNNQKLQSIDLWTHSDLTFTEFSAMLRESTEPGSLLLGYSMGGRLALHSMTANPEHWGGAVIVSAHPGLCCVQERIERRVSDEIWAKNAREMDWPDFLKKWNHQSALADSSIDERQFQLEAQREKMAFGFENWSLGKQDDLRPSLAKFKKPVLWITGELDRKFSRLGEEMAEVFPDFHHVIIPNSGHRVLLDATDQLADEVGRFYGRL